nr:hypothetical protein [Corynebacterium lactis]
MSTWKLDADGLIRAVDQATRTHPCEYVVASASGISLGEAVGPNVVRGVSAEKGLIRLAYGVYLGAGQWNTMSAAQRYVTQVKALVKRGSSAIITGEAAAAFHGLPLLLREASIPLANSGLRAREGHSSGDGGAWNPRVRRVGNNILPGHVVEIEGRRVTDVPKSVIDICRTAASENGIIAADAALREWCTRAELHEVLDAYPRSRGNRLARSILATATGRSESIGESLTKKCVLDSGIASLDDGPCALLQQVEFYDSRGFVGRVDFFVPELNLVIEFDGATKYSAGSAVATEEILVREQAREKRLKNMNLDVLRLCWADVVNGACIEYLREFGIRQSERIRAGGLVFTAECGRFREAQLPFKVRALRQRRIDLRTERRRGLSTAPDGTL